MKTDKSITAAEEVQHFALDRLYLSHLNPRQEADSDGVAALAASIRACGLIQSLAGVADPKGRIAIVAGGRRLRALQEIAESGENVAAVPVKLAPDAETAATWAKAENVAREPLHPADEIRAYGKMAETGAEIAEIAAAFAVTEAHVARRMKLAALPAFALDALKEGRMSLTSAQHFTLAQSEDQQREALEAIEGRRFRYADDVKRFFTSAGVRPDDKRVVAIGLDAYETEGGRITRDLFSDTVVLHDEELVDRLFAAKLEGIAANHIADGWLWAEVIMESHLHGVFHDLKLERCYAEEGELSAEEVEEYDELVELANGDALSEAGESRLDVLQRKLDGEYSEAQKAVAGALIYVNYDGEVTAALGLIRADDREAAYDAGVLTRPEKPKAAPNASPFSNALADDLRAIELGAVQTALLAKPELVLDLLAFALSDASGDYTHIMGVGLNSQPNKPAKAEGYELDARLAADISHHPAPRSMVKAFETFRAEGKKKRNAEITRRFASVLAYKGGRGTSGKATLYDAIATETGADMRAIWTPTAESFFGRVKGDYLDALYCELFAVKPSDASAAAFAKKKKGEKAVWMEALFADPDNASGVDAAAIARIKAWRPKGY